MGLFLTKFEYNQLPACMRRLVDGVPFVKNADGTLTRVHWVLESVA